MVTTKPTTHPGSTDLSASERAARKLALSQRETTVAAAVDQLFELRGLVKQAEERIKALVIEVSEAIIAGGGEPIEGDHAIATLGSRTNQIVDPELFHHALGRQAFGAMTVSVSRARELMVAADLAAISETSESSVLYTKARPGVAK